MQFLKILFWVVVAVALYGFSVNNWTDVTLTMWGDILVDIKVPALLAITFLLGFLPPWLILRARLWTVKRRLEGHERQRAVAAPPPADPAPAEELPAG